MYAALPMSFEANAGQSDPRVKFLAHAPGYSLFLTDQEAVLSLPESLPTRKPLRAGDPLHHPKTPPRQNAAHPLRVRFLGGNADAVVAGSDELAAKSNYFIGNDPKQWHTNVANYSAVKYSGIYPGVDAVFHGDNRKLEFDFNVAPGADPHSIALEVDGARRMRLNRPGDVVLSMGKAQELVMNKPHIYQQLPEGRREITGNFVLGARNRIAFKLGPYDHTRPLVIDPTLVYSTYLGGGSGEEYAFAIAVDSSSPSEAPHADPIDCSAGCVVVAGSAQPYGVLFPTTPGSYDPGPPPASGNFAYISKLNPGGSGLVYSTFFGGVNQYGDGGDQIYAITIDSTGAAYFGGISETEDDTPTTPGSFMPVRPSEDPVPFLAKLSPDGSTLVYSTYLDGTPNNDTDGISGIAVDSSFSAYVTGNTTATDFPTFSTAPAGAFQTIFEASPDVGTAFVTKFSLDGSSLVYSTFLGGNYGENVINRGAAGAIALDSSNDAYVTGNTFSSNFPTVNPYIENCNSPCDDAFVSELNPTGSALVFSTFLGGTTANKDSVGLGIAVDSSNSVFVGGETNFTNFPVTSPVVQSSPGVGFITKFNQSGAGIAYSSYFNGDVDSVAVGPDDSAVIFGLTATSYGFESTAGALTLPACTTEGGCFFDFISKLTDNGSGLVFSTPIGANLECCGAYGALDSTGNAYIAGSTGSQQLPTTPGSFERTVPSTDSGFIPFVAEVAFSSSSSPITISPATLPVGFVGGSYPISFNAIGGSGTGYTWSVTSGGTALTNVGLQLTTGGMISGTPNATETAAPFTVQVTDSQGNDATQNYTLTIYPDFSVMPTTLPAGTLGTPYMQMFMASGGSGGPFSFSVGSGTALSAVGLILSGTGTISGTPSTTETAAPFTLRVTDSQGDFEQLNYTLTINSTSSGSITVNDPETITVNDSATQVQLTDVSDPESITVTDIDTVAVMLPLNITTAASAPTGIVGVPYTPIALFTASGGVSPYTWSATDLPAGLSIDKSTGVISGTPTASGEFLVTVTVTDSLNNSVFALSPLTVTPPAPIANLSPTSLTFGPQASGTASAAQTVTLSNTGSALLNLSGTGLGISISGANATDFTQTSPSCGTSVAAGGNCAISVTFTPSLSAGSETAELNVADNASGTPQQVQLSGFALPPPSVSCTIPTITLSGDSGTAQITCTATDFTGTIALECNLPTSLSQYVTCSFNPSSLNFASSATQTTTLTIQQVQGASLQRKSWPWAAPTGGVAFGAVLWLPAWAFVMRRKKGRSKRGILFLLILLCGLPLITSCGGKSGPPTPPAGTYQASVMLTGPGLNETITFTIQEP